MASDIAKSLRTNAVWEHMHDAGSSVLSVQDRILLQGQIQKRGSKLHDAFLSRWVVVRPMCITYSKFENTKVIDRIELDEVIGIGTRGIEESADDGAQASRRPGGAERAARESSSTGNAVFWRFKSEMLDEKRAAFSYRLASTDFALFTSPIGFHRGRTFVFRVDDMEAREGWTETISRLLNARKEKPVVQTTAFFNLRKRVRSRYIGDHCQIGVAALILGNFVLNICQAQISDDNADANRLFEFVDLGFTTVFTIELLVNIFATFLWEFVGDPWNWFDLIVVLVSLISLILTDLPGADVLRLMRCFRVFRLFKRIASLRKITGALTKSLVPMGNAFCIVCLVVAIYAIIGVTFFSTVAPHNFSSFFIAFFSLFQSMTGDNWSEDCRDLMAETGQGPMVGIFYVSYMLLVSLVLVNVVIAVLLDAFGKASEEEAAQSIQGPTEQNEEAANEPCPFERIAKDLCVAGDLAALELKIEQIWVAIVSKGCVILCVFLSSLVFQLYDTSTKIIVQVQRQIDNFNTSDHEMSLKEFSLLKSAVRAWRYKEPKNFVVTYIELRRGVKMLSEYIPPLIISRNQYAAQVIPFCNHRGLLGGMGFRGLMKTILRRYQLRELHRAQMQHDWSKKSIRAVMIGMAGLFREDMESQRAGRSANRMKIQLSSKCDSGKTPDPLNQMVLSMLTEVRKMDSRFHKLEANLHRVGESAQMKEEGSQEEEKGTTEQKAEMPHPESEK